MDFSIAGLVFDKLNFTQHTGEDVQMQYREKVLKNRDFLKGLIFIVRLRRNFEKIFCESFFFLSKQTVTVNLGRDTL